MAKWTIKTRQEPKVYMNDAVGREAMWSSLRNKKRLDKVVPPTRTKLEHLSDGRWSWPSTAQPVAKSSKRIEPVYFTSAEGREAMWSAPSNPVDHKSVPQTKISQPEQVFCDSSQYEYHCNDVENKRRNNSDGGCSAACTPPTFDSTSPPPPPSPPTFDSTTPPPPPPLQSPPPLQPRPASQRRRTSSTSSTEGWPCELTDADADPDPIITRSATYRLKTRADAVTATCWMDDLANNNNNSNDDDELATTPRTRPRVFCYYVQQSIRSASPRPVSNGSGDDDDDDGPTVDVEDGPTVDVEDDPTVDVEDDPTPEMADDDDRTLVHTGNDDGDDGAHSDTGVRRSLSYNDEAVGSPATVVPDSEPPSKHEMRVKEIDENIIFYTKVFLCAFMFFILCHVWYYSNWFLRAFLFFVLLPHLLTRLDSVRAPRATPAPHE